jgi:hypothetical protein
VIVINKLYLDTDLGSLRKNGDVGLILTAGPLDTCGVAYTNTLTSGFTFGLVAKDCATGILHLNDFADVIKQCQFLK